MVGLSAEKWKWKKMNIALAWPPLSSPLPPGKLAKSRRSCWFCSAISETDSPSSSQLSSSTSSNYRPAIILPGLGNNTTDYEKLTLVLKKYGVPTVVVKVSRIDWLRNAAGLLDPNYWRGTLCPRPVLDWYFRKMDEAINEANELAQGGALSFIGHSAGGWLARAYMQEFGFSNVSLILTLGTPHLPAPKGLPGVIDQTRGLLDYVEKNCSKAVYSPELRYVCVAGRYIKGTRFLGSNNDNAEMTMSVDQQNTEIALVNTSKPPASTLRARFIGQGYKQVCGQADVWGDGVVPEISAHLEGALNISLEGVYHSPVGSDDVTRPWQFL